MKILIAEDDKHIGEGLCAVVEAEGYTTLLAADGELALQLFHEQRPQVILLDIMMPKRDGYAVCREIRKIDDNVPVIFISAKSEEIDRVIGLELGADGKIKARIAHVLPLSRAVEAHRLMEGDQGMGKIVLDPAAG